MCVCVCVCVFVKYKQVKLLDLFLVDSSINPINKLYSPATATVSDKTYVVFTVMPLPLKIFTSENF